jgi:hypothetical protein
MDEPGEVVTVSRHRVSSQAKALSRHANHGGDVVTAGCDVNDAGFNQPHGRAFGHLGALLCGLWF